MTMNRHEPWDELVSASLTGDLSADERLRLDAHLDTCAECRATLAAFADQRRIVAGLRHLPVPRDLGARVRTGIEGGSRVGLPWWRRPATIFAAAGGGLAAVAGALLAIVLLNGSADGPPVGETSPTPSGSVVAESASPVPSAPAPTASPAESAAAPSPEATQPATLVPASPEPDVYLAVTGPFDNQQMTVRHGPTGETIMELGTSAVPIAAELSPDGQWLAYITEGSGSGINELRATRIAEEVASADPDALPPADTSKAVGDTVVLGESVAGSPFLEQLAWASNSRYLAYTLAGPEASGTDVWLFGTALGEVRQITDVGDAYAGSWIPSGTLTSLLWVSTAGAQPTSYLLDFPSASDSGYPRDPADNPMATADGIFQPLLSPNGGLAIYWKGSMDRSGDEWLLSQGGAPYLAEHQALEGEEPFSSERELFSDVTIEQDAFTSAAIAWGADSDAYAVWNALWTGIPQGSGGEYPNVNRVYFGHATDPQGLTERHALDAADIPEGARVVDVKVSPTGEHLVISAAQPRGGVQEAPVADLLLVKRNTGNLPDAVVVMRSREDGWFGPGAFDAITEAGAE